MDEELQPRSAAQPAIPVVAEDRGDSRPHIGHVMQRHPRAEADGKPWIRRQATADPNVEAWAVLGMNDPDEGDVVHLVADILLGGARDGRLVLPRKVGECRVPDEAALDLLDRWGAVDDLVGR